MDRFQKKEVAGRAFCKAVERKNEGDSGKERAEWESLVYTRQFS